MKLTIEDKAVLEELGVRTEDFEQVEPASHARYTTYELDGNPIPREKAIELLGREDYLAGLVKSAFHWSCAMPTPCGNIVGFDSSKLFKA